MQEVAQDCYVTGFITDSFQTELWVLIVAALIFIIILGGVRNGVERMSKIMMPILVLLAIVVTIYSVTRPGALAGVKYFLIPNMKNFSFMTIVAAMGQMFYSLSIAMGILYTYGSVSSTHLHSTDQICQLNKTTSKTFTLIFFQLIVCCTDYRNDCSKN